MVRVVVVVMVVMGRRYLPKCPSNRGFSFWCLPLHISEANYNSFKSMLALSEEYTHDEWGAGGGGNLRRWGFYPCLDAEVNVPLLQGCYSKECNF